MNANLVRKATQANGLAFIINGISVGTLLSRVPDFKELLNVSTGTFGTALFFAACGVLTALTIVGRFAAKYGSAPMTTLGGLAFALFYPVLGLLDTLIPFCCALFIFGFTLSWQDLSMNAQAHAIESLGAKRIMSRFHAMWSIGAVLGGSIGGLFAQQNISILTHLISISLLSLLLHIYIGQNLLPGSSDQHAPESKVRVRRPLIFWQLGLIGFCAAIAEGASGDWGGILLRETFGASPFIATLPYIVFSTMMVVGRLLGDHIAAKYGVKNSITVLGFIAGIGLSTGLIVGGAAGITFGWFFVGIGVSIVLPLMFSAAGDIAKDSYSTKVAPSQAIAMVSGIAYFGFLVGPPFIGWIAEITSLRKAMFVPALLTILLAITVQRVIPSGKRS